MPVHPPVETVTVASFGQSQGAATRTVSLVVPADKLGVLDWILWSVDGATSVSLTVVIGSTTLLDVDLPNDGADMYHFDGGMYRTVLGEDITVTLTATGGANQLTCRFR